MEKFSSTLLSKNKVHLLSYIVILAAVSLHFYLISSVELSYDEAYYWIYSKNLAWGYYDHPPMVGFSIYLGNLIFGHSEFGVRSLYSFYFLASVYLLFKLVKGQTGLLSFLALVISMPLISLSAMAALPDGALMFGCALYFYCLKNYLIKDDLKSCFFLAFAIAFMFYSKYHGLLIVLLSVLANISFLKKKSFWMVVVITTILYLPHVYWQYQHDFISFKFHLFGRVEKHFDIKNIIDYVLGQIFLMGTLFFPLFFIILKKNKFTSVFERILIFNSLGFLGFLLLLSFRNQIEANWTITVSMAMVLLMAPYIKNYKKYSYAAISFNLVIFFLIRGVLIIPETIINESNDHRLNELIGWDKKAQKIKNICDGLKVVGDNYQITAKYAFYENKPDIAALHLGSRESQYSLLNLEKNIGPNDKICYLTSKNILNASKVESGFKDPIYVISDIDLTTLANYYGIKYEEIIRRSL